MTIFTWNEMSLAERQRVLMNFFNTSDFPLDISPEMEWDHLPRWLVRELVHV